MKVPEIRFEQYKEPFKHVQLGNLTKKSKILNKRGQNKNLLSLSYGKIVRKDIESKKGLLPGSFNSYQIIQKNSIIFRCTDLQNDKKSLRVGLSMQEGIISPAYIRMDCDTTQVLPEYLFNQLHYHDSVTKVYYTMGDGLRQTLSFEDLKELDIYLPDFDEQQDIVNYFQLLDDIILFTTKKIEKLKQTKEASLVAMFPQKGETKPRVRFKDFKEEWKCVQLKDISHKVATKNRDNFYQITLTNSAEHGIVNQLDFFDHEVSNNENIVGYYIVDNDDFVYNPRISVTAPVGPINRNKLGYTGVISPLYYVFKVHDINKDYLSYFFQTTLWHKFMLGNGNSGARFDRLSIADDIFVLMPILMPDSEDEQQEIANFFSCLDKQISLEEQKLEKLKRIKSACLDKMFI